MFNEMFLKWTLYIFIFIKKNLMFILCLMMYVQYLAMNIRKSFDEYSIFFMYIR